MKLLSNRKNYFLKNIDYNSRIKDSKIAGIPYIFSVQNYSIASEYINIIGFKNL